MAADFRMLRLAEAQQEAKRASEAAAYYRGYYDATQDLRPEPKGPSDEPERPAEGRYGR